MHRDFKNVDRIASSLVVLQKKKNVTHIGFQKLKDANLKHSATSAYERTTIAT